MRYLFLILFLFIFVVLIFFLKRKNKRIKNLIQQDSSIDESVNYEKLNLIIEQYEKKLFAHLVFNQLEALEVRVSIKKVILDKVGMVPLFPMFDVFVSQTYNNVYKLNNLVSAWLVEKGVPSNNPINDLENLLTEKLKKDAEVYVAEAIKSINE